MNTLKRFSLIAVLLAALVSPAIAQTPAEFDKAYWLSKPTEVQALQYLEPNSNEALDLGVKLATAGFEIDKVIMVNGLDPYRIMQMRKMLGYTWVPRFLQPDIPLAPGLSAPGSGWTEYDPVNPPKGAVVVSCNINDYPPFNPPKVDPPAVEPSAARPGVPEGGPYYGVLRGDTSPDGTVFKDSTGVYVKHIQLSPFGKSAWWVKQ